ncbi:hypothetical protein E2C01_026963 [Portunus trituberculatus]|uniref:Uncharacterized protein n=1 Tax=Portunus trituberculatus TaxID=210409 RepID=A0A5B7EJW0_PORTR|nr:hypothetical protein [Portunus trituberculatus]
MLLTSGQRGQALHLLDIRNMSVSASRVTFKIAITDYLERTKCSQGLITRFFITTKLPTRLASRDTLRPHSTRSASSSKAALKLPLATIVSAVGWARESIFVKFYRKTIQPRWPVTKVSTIMDIGMSRDYLVKMPSGHIWWRNRRFLHPSMDLQIMEAIPVGTQWLVVSMHLQAVALYHSLFGH